MKTKIVTAVFIVMALAIVALIVVQFRAASTALNESSSTSQVIRAFRKTIEVAALTLDEALLLKADGHDILVILVTDVSDGGDAILGKPDVATPPIHSHKNRHQS